MNFARVKMHLDATLFVDIPNPEKYPEETRNETLGKIALEIVQRAVDSSGFREEGLEISFDSALQIKNIAAKFAPTPEQIKKAYLFLS